MPKFRENRIALLYAHQQRLINDKNLYFYTTSVHQQVPTFLTGHTIILTWILCQTRSVKQSFTSIEMTYIRCLMFCNYLTKLYAKMDSMSMVPRFCVSCLKDSHIHVDILTLCQGLPNLFHSHAWYQIM